MSSLQNKMNNYEVVPPASVWDRVDAALDESALGNEFPNKLYNAEVIPPAAAWENIQTALHPEETKEETKVVPLKKRTIPAFVRYAAAAILIGAVAFGVLQMTGGSSGNNLAKVNTTDTSTKHDKNIDDNHQSVTDQQIIVNSAPNPQDLVVAQPQNAAKVYTNKGASALYSYADPEQYDPLYDYAPYENPADRYIMFMTPEGNIVRMSKKLGDLVCCVSGEEQDEGCKTQIKKWQEKLANSPAASSPGNFLDILSLLSSLDENTGIEL
jgi:hypothetical protein